MAGPLLKLWQLVPEPGLFMQCDTTTLCNSSFQNNGLQVKYLHIMFFFPIVSISKKLDSPLPPPLRAFQLSRNSEEKGSRDVALPLYQLQLDRTHDRSLRQRGFNSGNCCYVMFEV